MKTRYTTILAVLTLLGASITSCSGIDDDGQATGKTVVLTGQLADKGGHTTRTLNADGTTEWTQGEQVAVYYETATGGHSTATATVENADGMFTATLTNPKAGGTAQFVYPASRHDGSGGYQTTGISQQDGALGSVSQKWDITTGQGTMTVGETEASMGEGTVPMTAQMSIFHFTLKDGDGEDVNAATLTIGVGGPEPAESYTITPAQATHDLYVALKPVADGAVLSFTATTAAAGETPAKTYSKTTDEAASMAPGHFYNSTVTLQAETEPVPEPEVTDLSMVDCAGNARTDGQWTANCYMVHTAGKYKLPLVYGNAIKGGQTNVVAYTGIGANNIPTFVNHADVAIADPWIKNHNVTVDGAELLWQDAEGLITEVGIDGDYLTLTVGKDAETQEGNAVIAAKAGNTIVWSWHIWLTKQTFSDLTEVAATVTSNNTSYIYKLTPVNLGWVGDATSTTGYNTYYQWGRKDAFIPSTGIKDNTANHTVYDISNHEVTGFSHTFDNSVTIGGNIQNPTVHNYTSISGGPCNTVHYKMWDAQQANFTIVAAATVKTVYDPCPPGFCVPTMGLYTYIGSQTIPEWNTGYTHSGVFFPASGYRYYLDGILHKVGTIGYCWSATAYDSIRGRYFYFHYGSWGYHSVFHSYEYPVRAVAEDAEIVSPIPTLTGTFGDREGSYENVGLPF